jgi:hypothetical protein
VDHLRFLKTDKKRSTGTIALFRRIKIAIVRASWYKKLFRLGLAGSGFLFLVGRGRSLGTALRGSGLGRLFRRFFGIDDCGGGGVLLYRLDALNTRRLVFIYAWLAAMTSPLLAFR